MAKRKQHIGHSTSQADEFTGLDREVTVDTTELALRVHDGATKGGVATARKDLANVADASSGNDGKMTASQAVDLDAVKTDFNAHKDVGGAVHAEVGASAGFMSVSDKTKLDTIEPGAGEDLSAAEILALLLTVDGTSSGLDADKLDGNHRDITVSNNTVIGRDSSGRAKVAAPAASDDIAIKSTVDAVQTNLGTHAALVGSAAHGLGNASTKTVGVANGNVPQMDGVGYPVADGSQITNILNIASDNLVDATNGGADDLTQIDFTGIPANAKRITIMFRNISLSGTDQILIQLGDAGGFETVGYSAASTKIAVATPTSIATTNGFVIRMANAADVASGSMVLTLMDAATFLWASSHMLGESTVPGSKFGGGAKLLSDTLTQIRITRTGANTFDGGSVNIMIEPGTS